VVQHLFSEYQLNLIADEGDRWLIEEQTGVGPAQIEYQLSPQGGRKKRLQYNRLPLSPLALNSKTALSKPKIKSDTTFNSTSYLSHEEVMVDSIFSYTNDLELRLQGENLPGIAFKGPLLQMSEQVAPGESQITQDSEKKMLSQRVGEMTVDGLKTTYKQMANNPGVNSDRNRFVWQATGLLLQHPEYARELAKLFTQSTATSAERSLILDLLANAGNDECQQVLRELLSDKSIQQHETYPLWYQRLSFVNTPNAATLEFSKSSYHESKKGGNRNFEYSTANSLGAIVSARSRIVGQHEPEISEVNQELLSALNASQNNQEKRAYLLALGNAGFKTNTSVISSYANDADPDVRASVAVALRKTENDQAKGTLKNLIADRETVVQRSAIDTLIRFEQTPQDQEEFAQSLKTRAIRSESFGLVVKYIETKVSSSTLAKEMLDHILKHEDLDQELKAYAHSLMNSL
jgi:hypothetical protein